LTSCSIYAKEIQIKHGEKFSLDLSHGLETSREAVFKDLHLKLSLGLGVETQGLGLERLSLECTPGSNIIDCTHNVKGSVAFVGQCQ